MSKDKEALKAQMMGVINRKPKKVEKEDDNGDTPGGQQAPRAN